MAELGPTAPDYHREVGELVGSSASTSCSGWGARARLRRRVGADAAEAAAHATDLVQPGDVVLVKGSRAVGLEVVAEALTAVRA